MDPVVTDPDWKRRADDLALRSCSLRLRSNALRRVSGECREASAALAEGIWADLEHVRRLLGRFPTAVSFAQPRHRAFPHTP